MCGGGNHRGSHTTVVRTEPMAQSPESGVRTEGLWPKELAKPSTADSRLINRGKINNANGNLSLLSAPWPKPKPKQKPKTMVHGHRTLDIGHWKTATMMRKITIPVLLVAAASTSAGSMWHTQRNLLGLIFKNNTK